MLLKGISAIIKLGQKEISVKQAEVNWFENKQMLYLYKSFNFYASGRIQSRRAKRQTETVR